MRRIPKFIRVTLFALAALATLIALFYAVEDWRGARAYVETTRQLEARGESLNPEAFIPPLIPDDQNLAMAPLFVRAFRYRRDPQSGELAAIQHQASNPDLELMEGLPYGLDKQGSVKKPGPEAGMRWREGMRRDLVPEQAYYRQQAAFPRSPEPQSPAEDVLLALSRYAPMLDELAREAAARPQTRFPTAWRHEPPWETPLDYYTPLLRLASALSLRATAQLAANHPGEAFKDVQLGLRLRQATTADPTIIAAQLSQGQFSSLLQPIWQGLADRRWNAAELERLENALQRVDMLGEFARGIRGERAIFLCRAMDNLKLRGNLLEYLRTMREFAGSGSDGLPYQGWQIALAPNGWIDQNKAAGCRYYQDVILNNVDPAARRVWPARTAAANRASNLAAGAGPYNFLARPIAPNFRYILSKGAWAQTAADQAATACALERYFLDHQEYPEKLDALVPRYCAKVPIDVIDGAAMRYRRTANGGYTADGRYMLYSIAWDCNDDGGRVAARDNASSAGDWVWQYVPMKMSPEK